MLPRGPLQQQSPQLHQGRDLGAMGTSTSQAARALCGAAPAQQQRACSLTGTAASAGKGLQRWALQAGAHREAKRGRGRVELRLGFSRWSRLCLLVVFAAQIFCAGPFKQVRTGRVAQWVSCGWTFVGHVSVGCLNLSKLPQHARTLQRWARQAGAHREGCATGWVSGEGAFTMWLLVISAA